MNVVVVVVVCELVVVEKVINQVFPEKLATDPHADMLVNRISSNPTSNSNFSWGFTKFGYSPSNLQESLAFSTLRSHYGSP